MNGLVKGLRENLGTGEEQSKTARKNPWQLTPQLEQESSVSSL